MGEKKGFSKGKQTMKRFKFRTLRLSGALWLAVLLAAGCAGPKPMEKDRSPKVEKGADRTEVLPAKVGEEKTVVASTPARLASESVAGRPSHKARKRAEQKGVEIKRAATGKTAATLPVSKADVVDAPGISVPEPARVVSRSAPGPKKKTSSDEKGPKIVLNFDDADLYAVITTISELLGLNYLVDPNVKGKVTINTAGGLYKKDLFPVFLQILEVNGLTAVKEGKLYRIVQIKDSPRMPIDMRFSLGAEDVPPMEKIIIQIIPLRFISAQEMTKLATPFISAGGTIVSDTASNTLLVVDKGLNILKILRLVQAFDVNVLERVYYRFYPLKNLEAEDTVKTLTDFMSAYQKVGNLEVKFIPMTRLNTIFVVSSTPLVFDKIEDIIGQIDVVDEEIAPRIYVYFVKNGAAEDLAALLEIVFIDKSSKEDTLAKKRKPGGSAAIAGNPFSVARMTEKKQEKAAEKARAKEPVKKTVGVEKGAAVGSGTLMAEVHITPDVIRNALIIEAIPSDYRTIEEILRQIDILPRQVLIEATIAEITVNTSTELGMEWQFGKGAASGGTGSFAAAINSLIGAATQAYTGLQYQIGVTDKWYAALHAMAKDGNVNIISSPHVLASDNTEAKIDVSREIPIASGSTTVASGATVSETTIEYRDTGVILSVTPHINERGLVTMDISQEVSDLEKDSILVAGKRYPAFFKRKVDTTLTVGHGQTVVIGGLIRDKEEESITGVPCLIKIPVVRYLFGEWGTSVEKVELIVLITPRVVANLDDIDAATREFKQKVKNVTERFFHE